MKVKTYGVPGLSEWYGKVKAGNIEVEVQFKGGTASPSGAQPAYFVTKDPITQFVIENSKEFKQGFIILVMQHELPGAHPRMAVPKPKTVEQNVEVPEEDENPKEPVEEPATEENGEVPEAITVSSLDDAKDYLNEHFGIAKSQLRSRNAIEERAKENGVVFFFKNA